MATIGWQQLIPGGVPYRGSGRFPIDAYSEFMPPPRLGWKPYGKEDRTHEVFSAEDPWGWQVSEYEENLELKPGLEQVASQVIHKIQHLISGDPAQGLSRRVLADNVYWPDELAQHAGKLTHEHCVVLLPLALSRTQDDKGRVRWTLFGNSEQGPARAFWKSFFTSPGTAGPEDDGPRFFCQLLQTVFEEKVETPADLLRVGFRILADDKPPLDFWAGSLAPGTSASREKELPGWTVPYLLDDAAADEGSAEGTANSVKYLLTFRPFGRLPQRVQQAYLRGDLHLLPCPASLVFWGMPRFHRLFNEASLLIQAPLLYAMTRHRGGLGLRVPQAGLLHEPNHHGTPPSHPELVKNKFKRTHRWDRILRDQDELALLEREEKLLHVLFSTIPDDLGLYDKPLARNVQMWTSEGDLLLDGPSAEPEKIKQAMHVVQAGGLFGYRFQHPAMRVGLHEVYWHRPLAAFLCPRTQKPMVLPDTPLGYLTAYPSKVSEKSSDELGFRQGFRHDRADLEGVVELWPRLQKRPLLLASTPLYHQPGKGPSIARNVRKLSQVYQMRGQQPLPRALVRQLVHLSREESLEQWLASLKDFSLEGAADWIEPEKSTETAGDNPQEISALTYRFTARRPFEVTYWKTIASLAEGRFLNKNNADCVRDPVTQSLLPYHGRHLDALGDYLLSFYRKQIARAKMTGKAHTGSLPFRWRTDLDYSWMEGWLKNQEQPSERNLLTIIPGKDRSRAVIMADHYDTAYMADRYEKSNGSKGARLAACGADDNHSATAALMLAAPIFLELSKEGRLDCDVWLVHLTGEEFPADCLGARHLTQALVESNLALHLADGEKMDLSHVRIQGVYVSDMIAHNNDRERDVFQIAPGTGGESFWLAEQAHEANMAWNASVPAWNRRPSRRGQHRARRSPYGAALPETTPHLALSGEVRPVIDPTSTLFNTDGQIFSDAGVPVVLFMENYDINRSGYHDTLDTMANIDLDYGAALAAIVIESVARAACAESPR